MVLEHDLEMVDNSPQLKRAKCIPDAEWDAWRERLVTLYLKDEVSRKDIVDTMAKEHKFEITEKQLKHRFQRWGVRKYISESDMTIMLSMKKDCDAAGKQVSFQYKGHEIDQGRIERASKRRKGPLPSTTTIPPYIKCFDLKRRDPPLAQHIYQDSSITYSRTENDLSPAGQSLPVHRTVRDWDPATDRLNDFRLCMGDLYSPADSVFGLPIIQTTPPADSFSGTVSRAEEMKFRDESPHNSPPMDSASNFSILQQPRSSCTSFCGERTSPHSNSHRSDFDMSAFLNLSPEIQSPTRTAFFPPKYSDRRIETSYGPNSAPLQEHGTHSDIVSQDVPRSSYSLTRSSISASITLEGGDPEDVVLPLQALESIFPMHLVRHDLEGFRYSDCHLVSLLDMVNSTWLHLEIENLLCWSYEKSAQTARLRQASRQNNSIDIRAEKSCHGSTHDRDPSRPDTQESHNSRIFPSPKPRLISFFTRVIPSSTLRIELWTESQGFLEDLCNPEPCDWLKVSFIPREYKRSKGLTVELITAQGAFSEPRICPRIKAFNVVPENSEVIRCVSRNDLPGLQKLFDNREASPLDVDPRGYSLLSYALYAGCSETFLLLLQGGAGTQNCNCFGSSKEVVWAIWRTFADYVSRTMPSSFYLPGVNRDFDQCVEMTDAALRHGCELDVDDEDSMCCKPQTANALFEMVEWWPVGEPQFSFPEKAINYLLKIGYDREKRNPEGLTPLLHAATSYLPQVIQCIRTFIREGANIHTTDTSGRGALHCALGAPRCFTDWKTLRLTSYILSDVLSYYYVPHRVFRTENTVYEKDYKDEGLDMDSLTKSGLSERPVRRGKVCLGKCAKARERDLVECCSGSAAPDREQSTLDWSVANDECDCGIDLDEYCGSAAAFGSPYISDDPVHEYVVCKDFAGAEHFIRHPIKILKTRLRFKLLIMLRANCDPNVLDNVGASPSDYARRDGLWPQWYWALKNTGYSYDPRSDRWVRAKTS